MRVLWLLTRDLDGTGAALAAEHGREHEVLTLDLRRETDFAAVLDAVETADRVVSW